MQLLDEVLTRGVEKIYPDTQSLKNALSQKKLRIYCGFDPTGSTLHLGHVVNLLKLRAFYLLGHEVFVVIGTFTARIGDPDKAETRTKLTIEQVKENASDYVRQIRLFFPEVDDEHIKYNSEWLDKMDLSEMLEYLSYFTHAQIIERDLFQARLKKGSSLAISELMYPIMQAIDSDKLNIDLELGGADQTFNMLIGKELMRKKNNKEKFVLTNRLLVDEKGEKAGKTTGNMIAITDSPKIIWDKILQLPRDLIKPYMEGATDLDKNRIDSLATELTDSSKINTTLTELANYFIEKIHGQKSVDLTTESIAKVEFKPNQTLLDIAINSNLFSSNSEAKNRISEGVMIGNKKITDFSYQLEDNEKEIYFGKKNKVVRE